MRPLLLGMSQAYVFVVESAYKHNIGRILPFSSMMRYECCEGYQQSGEDQGCTSVKPLKNLLETAEDLGATR